MLLLKLPIAMLALLKHITSVGAFDIQEWAKSDVDTSDIHRIDKHHGSNDTKEVVTHSEKVEDETTEAQEMEAALKALEDETNLVSKSADNTIYPANDNASHEEGNSETKEGVKDKIEQPKIEIPKPEVHEVAVPKEDYEPIIHITPAHEVVDGFVPATESNVTALIPKTPADDHNTTSGNEDSIINDTTPVARNMRLNTIAKIDETIEKLDKKLGSFLEAVSASTHDLSYYQSLLETAYDTFCKEINGDLTSLGSNKPHDDGDVTPVNVMISAEMSSAIRRSFDTKVEVLELAASEVATQKSKEVGARTIHDALTAGLILVRSTIASPGLTIHSTSNEMKNMTAIVADMAKSLLADIIKWTLKEDVLKKKLFDKIVERDDFIKKLPNDSRVEAFTRHIRKLAGEFHMAQNEKAGAIQKQNGFKEYMDEMREDINTIQRLIDTYFATVHNGHAKAIIEEATNELNKDGKAESELRLRLSEEKVHHEALLKSEGSQEPLKCPPNYIPLHPSMPVGEHNPCIHVEGRHLIRYGPS
uniref:BOV57 n=1 Tax=Babesia orientalis TaxID=273649 RepID=A0A7D3QU90_9APIC|nr:P53 [Babesia orientalis]